MLLQELLAQGPVESLDVGVHLGRAWVCVIVDDTLFLARFSEPEGELASVVGLDLFDWSGRYVPELLQEVRSRADEWLVYAPAKAKRGSMSMAV